MLTYNYLREFLIFACVGITVPSAVAKLSKIPHFLRKIPFFITTNYNIALAFLFLTLEHCNDIISIREDKLYG